MPAPIEMIAVDQFWLSMAISRCICESPGKVSIDEQSRTTNGVSLAKRVDLTCQMEENTVAIVVRNKQKKKRV